MKKFINVIIALMLVLSISVSFTAQASAAMVLKEIKVLPFENNPKLTKAQNEEALEEHKNQSKVVYIEVFKTHQLDGIKYKKLDTRGTGFLLPNGYIMTNYHVAGKVNETDELEYRISFFMQEDSIDYIKADFIGGDFDNDIAILKVKQTKEIPVEYKNSYFDLNDFNLSPNLDDTVTIIGHPGKNVEYSNESNDSNGTTVNDEKFEIKVIVRHVIYTWNISKGNVIDTFTSTNVTYTKLDTNITFTDTIKVNAPTFPGNSGSPLLDSNNKVIGIIFAATIDGSAGYAIKTDKIFNLIGDLGIMDKVFKTKK